LQDVCEKSIVTGVNESWSRDLRAVPLENGQVHVWAVDLDESVPVTASLAAALSADEVARADRFHFPRDRVRFIRGREALRNILGGYLQVRPADLKFDCGTKGKPVLAEHSNSGNQLHFNLSHSEKLAVIAVTTACEVGIDVERIHMLDDFKDISNRYFSPVEIQALEAAPDDQKLPGFFDLWTRKESLIKATGEGLTECGIAFNTLSKAEMAAGRLNIQPEPVLLKGWTLHRFVPRESFRAALAVSVENLDVVTGVWDCPVTE
jgi:4'-phosphopantetheinyl transferase